MKLLKNLAIAAITAVTTIAPAMARVEDGTADLLRLLADNGINVTINEECDGTYHGVYSFVGMKREMHLCPGASVDAVDHATVRHEAIHAVQHCVNTARGTAVNTPVMDMDDLVDAVNSELPESVVTFVKESYDPEHWAIEMEANLLERTATSEEIAEYFTEACVGG